MDDAVAVTPRPLDEPIARPPVPERSPARRFVALIVIGAAVAQALGLTLKMPSQVGANDISRWCTVWGLLERGTYAIDDCPWQGQTMDKVKKPAPFAPKADDEPPPEHFYSSKPPLLPTLIAGLLYPVRKATRVPLDHEVEQPRVQRKVLKPVKGSPGKNEVVVEKPEPVKWPVHVFYFKPVIVLLNVVPFWIFLILYARLLDRYAGNDWAWFLSLAAAAWATPLFAFDETLNNHTVGAFSGFFALYHLLRIWDDGDVAGWRFALAGFFGAFCACNELPAALFGVLLFGMLVIRFPRPTLIYFVPAAAVPCLAFLATQYAALGTVVPAYAEFGGRAYNYEGSYWTDPLEMDALQEPKGIYLFHMTFGHHGVFSLTPIFLFSAAAMILHLVGRMRRQRALAWLTAVLTVAILAFYTWKTNNYGGSTQGLRWLFWLFPFWLALLPPALEPGESHRGFRWLSLAAFCLSVLSVGYALRNPWSHPWLLDWIEHLNLYTLVR